MTIDETPSLLVGMQPRCCGVFWSRRLLAGRQGLHMVMGRLLAGRQGLHMLSSCVFMGEVEMDLERDQGDREQLLKAFCVRKGSYPSRILTSKWGPFLAMYLRRCVHFLFALVLRAPWLLCAGIWA
jgi:hypothetical protein